MKATKEELINFLEARVFIPNENNIKVTPVIKRKINTTRMRLNQLNSPEKVVEYFWSALVTDGGIDSHKKIKEIGGVSFEDVVAEFKILYDQN